jgi:Uma2 family endonuclease
MLQTEPTRLTVSHALYLEILRENPDLRIERNRDGRLIVMPPTGHETSIRSSELIYQLMAWNRATGLGVVSESNGGYVLPDGATRAPDAAWVSRERESTLDAAQRAAFAPLCPDFVAELLAPSDDLDETREKVAEFIENGARLGWLIDPFRKAVEIYRPGQSPETIENARSVNGESVLLGVLPRLGADLLDLKRLEQRPGGASWARLRVAAP